MQRSVKKRNEAGSTRSLLILLTVATLSLANTASSLAAAPEVSNKKDGGQWRMSWWLGGFEGTGGPEKLYFWMEFGPWNSVFKQTPDGLYWFHDSMSKGVVTIASAKDGGDANTEPYDVRYVGVGTMVDTGLWKENENDPSLIDPTEMMTWTIKATVFKVGPDGQATREKWQLYWHLLLRGGEYTENYSFEPAK
jgi:hypothetical protein